MQRRMLATAPLVFGCVMGLVLSSSVLQAEQTVQSRSTIKVQEGVYQKVVKRAVRAPVKQWPDSVFALKTIVTGNVNGNEIEGIGSGLADDFTGEARLDYTFNKMSHSNDYFIFAPLMSYLMNALSRTVEGGENPFRGTGVVFTRTVFFPDYGDKLTIKTRYEKNGQTYNATYDIRGAVPSVEVTAVDQSVEDLIQGGNNQVFGVASQTWFTRDGKRLRAVVETTYNTLEGEHWAAFTTASKRFVTTQVAEEGDGFIYAQQATIFANLPGHVSVNKTLPRYIKQ